MPVTIHPPGPDETGPYEVVAITEARQYVTILSGAAWQLASEVAAAATQPGEMYVTANITAPPAGGIRATWNGGRRERGGGPLLDGRTGQPIYGGAS